MRRVSNVRLNRTVVSSARKPAVVPYTVCTAAGLGVLIGGFWLTAWFLGWGAQWSASRFITPKTNLALGVFLAGSALLLLWPKNQGQTRRSAGTVTAALVLLIGALTLSEHLFHYDLGIDQLLATELPGAAATTSPNRMGPPAAMSLTLLGLGFLLLSSKRGKVAPYFGLSVILISLVPAVGYLYGIDAFFGKAQLTGIAWPTVVALLSLGIGLVLAETESGPMAMLLREDAGGNLLRRMLPAAVLIPALLGFVVMQARHRELLDRATATGLLVIALAVIFSMLLWRSAAHLSHAAAAEADARQALRQERDVLQTTINGAIHSHLVYLDRDFNFVRVNEAYAKTCGYTPDEMIGKNHFALYPHPENEAIFARVRDTGEAVEFHDRPFIFPDQPERGVTYWDWTLSPVEDEKGSVNGLVFALFETTERKRGEEELARLASFPMLNPYPISEVDRDGRVQFMNPAARTLFPDLEQQQAEHPWLAGWDSVVSAVGEAQTTIQTRDVSVGERQFLQTIWYVPQTRRIRIYGLDITERKQAQETLRRIEEERTVAESAHQERQRFLDVLETLPVMVCLLTPDYHVAWANRSFRERFGESNGRHCYEYCFNRTEPCDFCESYNVLKSAQPHRWEVAGPGGSVFEAFDFPFTDVDGSPLILEMDIDITEQRRAETELKQHRQHLEELVRERTSELQTANAQLRAEIAEREQAERALRESEERFRVAQELSPDGFSILRPVRNGEGRVVDFTWVFVNASTERFVGKKLAALAGRSLLELFPGHRGSLLLETYCQVAETGQTRVCEALYHGDGSLSEHWFRVAVVSMGRDIAVLSQDITERKQAGEALRESEERFALSMEATNDGLWDWNAETDEVYYSPSYYRILGFEPGAFPGTLQAWKELVHPEDLKRTVQVNMDCVEGRSQSFTVEYRLKACDGQWRWILGRGKCITRNAQGRAIRLIGTHVDITERKRTEELLMRSEKVAALGRMAAGLAHDINNPLSAVMNTLFLARSNQECVECAHSVRQYLDLADGELKRISHITHQALGFYRDGSAPARVSIRAILDETVDIFKSKIRSKHAKVEKLYEGDIIEVVGIVGELRQVFSNLFANSLDAISENGTIKLKVSSFPGRGVQIAIADDGKGIEPSAMGRIFEPLFTTKGSLGTGLGLWVTKQLVDKHGGSIRVRSRANGRRRGTTFSVFLPPPAAARSQANSV